MIRVCTGKEKKAIDRYAIETLQVPSLSLMERAAMAVAREVKKEAPKSVICVCGSGNNGGDGIAVARLLRNEGIDAEAIMIGRIDAATPEVLVQWEQAKECEVNLYAELAGREIADFLSSYDLIVDAVFGIGLSREVNGSYAAWIEAMDAAGAPVIAVDIPSGIDAATGKVLGCAVHAKKTVTFGTSLIGLTVYPECLYAGQIVVEDIFPEEAMQTVRSQVYAASEEDFAWLPKRKAYSNKGTYGRVLVVAGSKESAGCAYLAAKAAYRMGAGLVKVLTHEVNRTIVGTLVPEALLSVYDDQAEAASLRSAFAWADAIVIGPGIGKTNFAAKLLTLALLEKKPTVVDADAIHLLKERQEGIPANVILTPHVKEMADFLGISVREVAEDVRGVCERTAAENAGILVLKDARTFVSDTEMVYINTSGNDGMATGGSGDVLAGMIGGLLAQKAEPMKAACLGVYLHGLAGDAAAKKRSRYAMLAGDLIDGIGDVLLQKGIQ